MSTNKFLPKLQEIQKRDGNKRCIDCNSPNPQWASVPFGILFCLECSGKHRALGVHISFVRSITMDKWSEQQVKKMDMGGNTRALEFFKESPDYSEDMTIEEKYTSHFAQNYREKLAAECEGKVWTPSLSSDPSTTNSAVNSPSGAKRSSNLGPSSRVQRTGSSESSTSRNSAPGQNRRGKAGNSSSRTTKHMGSGTSSPRGGNEEYFARLGEANESRRDDVPPNQGGKYTGFGNTPDSASSPSTPSVPDIGDLLVDPLGTLSKGWSLFSIGASSAIGQAAEGARNLNASVLQPASERLAETVRDPELQGRVSGYVSSLSRTVQDTGSKGFSFLSDYLQPNTQSYGQLDHEDNNSHSEDEDYSRNENFEPYRDTADEDENPEHDSWESTNHPVSGRTSSTRFGSNSMSPANSRGSDSMQLRKGKGAAKKKVDDSWGDENDDEWSKF